MLYHNKIFVPANITKRIQFILGKVIPLTYSGHAINAAQDDRYGTIDLPKAIAIESVSQVFEIETDSAGLIVKMGIRVPHDSINDLVIILSVNTQTVKTVWLNRKSDAHKSLDRNKYQAA